MATDYDAPRKRDEEVPEESLEKLKSQRKGPRGTAVDEDEGEAADSFEPPRADLSNEEPSVQVVSKQNDELTCPQCFMVHHISQLAYEEGDKPVCVGCAD